MKKTCTLFLAIVVWLVALTGTAFAQQTPQYSLYFLNPYAVNPAFAGMENTLVATGVYRKQWTNLDGAPETQHLNVHMPVPVISSGVGTRLELDRIGPHRTTLVALSYNYQFQIGRKGFLSAGVSGGYLQYTLDGDKLRTPGGQYGQQDPFSHNDPLLPESRITMNTPVIEAGVYVVLNKFHAGISAMPAYAPLLKSAEPGKLNLKPTQHYYFYSAYELTVGEEVVVRPGLLAKTDNRETQIEISGLLVWRESYTLGASYRGFTSTSRDAAVIFAGLRLNDHATLAYAFDVPLSALSAVNRGSHELLLRYSLNRPIGQGKLPPVIYNPRFF